MTTPSSKVDSLSFTRHLFRLRFTGPARFAHFLHGGAVHGLLCHALLERRLPAGLVFTAPESGRVTYDAGDAYHRGITLVGEAREGLGRIECGLRRIGGDSDPAPRMALGGNFEVEAVESLPPAEIDTEVCALTRKGEVRTLRFVSPLRLKRPVELVGDDGSHIDR